MKKIKVGILTMSDGREYLHKTFEELNFKKQRSIAEALTATGLFEVVEGRQIINSNTVAKEEGMRLRENSVEATIFNYTIWCYPQYTVAAQNFAPGPYLLFSNLHPSQCGMVGMLAAAGSLDQIGVSYQKLWGDVSESEVLERMVSFLKAASAVNRLRGLTFGNFGGRPLGMYTAVANLEQWQKLFGIDSENIEQDDIIRAGEKADEKEVQKAFKWLSEKIGNIAYDGKVLTEEKLKTQIRSYIGLRSIIENKKLDFVGIKAHGDLTDRYCTMDIAEAFLNDPYDWNGAKEPIVAATESDMDGALTMQIFKHLTGMPVLFADVRHYNKEKDVWYFSNSGTHATYFAGASLNPDDNLPYVDLMPETPDYPAGGASVHHFAKSGKVTLARLARKNGEYHLTIVPAEFVNYDRAEMEIMGSITTPQWPVAFAKLNVSADYFINNFPCNHIHGVYGDYVDDLVNVANILNIPVTIFKS